jgi:RNase P/RNase MRP subunit POP5
MARKRYFLVRVCGKEEVTITGEQFLVALIASVRKYFGEIGLSTIDPRLIRYDPQSHTAIVACEKAHEEGLQAATALVKEIDAAPITLLTVRTSGTIKGLSKRSRQYP